MKALLLSQEGFNLFLKGYKLIESGTVIKMYEKYLWKEVE